MILKTFPLYVRKIFGIMKRTLGRLAGGRFPELLLDFGGGAVQVRFRADPLGPGPPEPPLAILAAAGIDGFGISSRMRDMEPWHPALRCHGACLNPPAGQHGGELLKSMQVSAAQVRSVALEPR